MTYNPYNWYWIVADDESQVFSSASQSNVSVGDEIYQAWLDAGNASSKIDSYASLTMVLFDAGALWINIASTGSPDLNGNYSVSPQAQNNLNAIATYIMLNGTFPNGASSLVWFDVSGKAHTFASVNEFKTFATAIANFVASVSLYQNSSGASGSIPSTSIEIA